MGQSARKDKPRCPKCRENKEIRHPDPIAIKDTGWNVYVTLRCPYCKYEWKAKGPSAERYANAHGIKLYRPQ